MARWCRWPACRWTRCPAAPSYEKKYEKRFGGKVQTYSPYAYDGADRHDDGDDQGRLG